VEPSFELPKHLLEYDGHPDDRKGLMAWRAEVARVSAALESQKQAGGLHSSQPASLSSPAY
jgi:hypothetical protein